MAEYWEYNKEFKGKVAHEMVAAAIAVMSEDNTVENHVERVSYADKILTGEASVIQVCKGFSTNSTIKAHLIGGTDYTPDLAFVMGSLFNAFAGVSL